MRIILNIMVILMIVGIIGCNTGMTPENPESKIYHYDPSRGSVKSLGLDSHAAKYNEENMSVIIGDIGYSVFGVLDPDTNDVISFYFVMMSDPDKEAPPFPSPLEVDLIYQADGIDVEVTITPTVGDGDMWMEGVNGGGALLTDSRELGITFPDGIDFYDAGANGQYSGADGDYVLFSIKEIRSDGGTWTNPDL